MPIDFEQATYINRTESSISGTMKEAVPPEISLIAKPKGKQAVSKKITMKASAATKKNQTLKSRRVGMAAFEPLFAGNRKA